MPFNLFYFTQGVLHINPLSVIYFRYTTYSICISSNSDESKKLPDDGRQLSKHVGACILNKGVVQFSAYVGFFATSNNEH
jgi:hypothetical protein